MRPSGRDASPAWPRATKAVAQSAVHAANTATQPVDESSGVRTARIITAMDRAEISRKVEEIIRDQKTIPDDPLEPEMQLETLGFDSLDALNIVFALEETFGISLSDEEVREGRTLRRMVEIVEGHLQS